MTSIAGPPQGDGDGRADGTRTRRYARQSVPSAWPPVPPRTAILLRFVRQGLLMLPAVHAALCVRPDPTDPMLDRAMSVRLVSISGRASAEQSGFRGGRAWRTIARFAGVLARWVTMAASSPVMQAGKGTSVGNRPGRGATGESASLRRAGGQPRLAAN